MQDSDEFLRLLLDFLDGELRAAATGVPLHKALMMQAMPKKLDQWPPLQPAAFRVPSAFRRNARDHQESAQGSLPLPAERSLPEGDLPGIADLPTLFSVFFEGGYSTSSRELPDAPFP